MVAASDEPVATPGRETPEEPLNDLIEFVLFLNVWTWEASRLRIAYAAFLSGSWSTLI